MRCQTATRAAAARSRSTIATGSAALATSWKKVLT
jgi:hypothetical protein